MTLTSGEKEKLKIAERMVTRAILGLVQVTDGKYRMRSNLKIEKELKS